jgi:tight adherence protein B
VLSLFTGALGFFVGKNFTGIIGVAAPLISGTMAGAVPWIYRSKSRNKRLSAMEEQFPEALDFLARSVRAGNAFSIALELLAAETTEPLKAEILKLTREMALGAGLEQALAGMLTRVPLLEARLFVAAVLLQRETGGNLSEVLSKLAVAVRERMRLRGQVRAASGQGRLTAMVLSCLPVATLVMLKIVSPDYLEPMMGDPLGRNLLAAAVVSQVLGYLVMQKIIRIEV